MFRKIIVTIVFSLICVNLVYADANYRSVRPIKSSTKDTVFSVSGTGVVYTQPFHTRSLTLNNRLGIMYKATGTDTIDLKFDLEQTFKSNPTSGAADSESLVTDSVDASVTDTNWHMTTLDTVVMPYSRFIVTGQGSNANSTLFQIKVVK